MSVDILKRGGEKPKPRQGPRGEKTAARVAGVIAARKRDYLSGLAERVKSVLKGRNITELAPKLGVSRASMYDWSGGRHLPDLDSLVLLAWTTGVPLSWLLLGEGPDRADDRLMDRYLLPLQFPDTSAFPPLAFRRDWLLSFVRLFQPETYVVDLLLFSVSDDSMQPTLRTGDLLLAERGLAVLEPGDRLPPNGLYLFRGGVVRRVQWQIDGTAVISCDNLAYAAETRRIEMGEVKEKGDFILGRVLWHSGRI